jgi:hypothetical protein
VRGRREKGEERKGKEKKGEGACRLEEEKERGVGCSATAGTERKKKRRVSGGGERREERRRKEMGSVRWRKRRRGRSCSEREIRIIAWGRKRKRGKEEERMRRDRVGTRGAM